MSETRGLPAFRTFSVYCHEKFGRSVGKIPLDAGLPCPNRIHGGCIFCRSAGFTPAHLRGTDDIAGQLAAGKAQLKKGNFKKFFAYLQQETSTALPVASLLRILDRLLAESDCVGLILSTRPDYVADELLRPLAGLVRGAGKDCLFELGVQSVHERSLKLLNRRHSFADFQDAARRIQEAGCFQLGAHLIFGIPGESQGDMIFSLQTLCASGVTHLKFHHLQVIRDTPLATLYNESEVTLFTREGYLQFLLRVLPIIPAGVTLHRLWATAHPALLIAPKWNCLAAELSVELRRKMAEKGIWQGQLADVG